MKYGVSSIKSNKGSKKRKKQKTKNYNNNNERVVQLLNCKAAEKKKSM